MLFAAELPQLFVAGAFWFWVLIVAEAVLLYTLVHKEYGVASLVSVIAFFLVLRFMGDINIFSLIWNHPWQAALLTFGYGVVGVGWGLWKWTMDMDDRVTLFEDHTKQFLRRKKAEALTPELAVELKRELPFDERYHLPLYETPQFIEHIRWPMFWASVWVVDMSMWVMRDMVKRFFMRVYRRLAIVGQKITDKIYSRIKSQSDLMSGKSQDV